jgi:hypothetical protein
VADIYHWRRHHYPHEGPRDGWALVRALLGGAVAIVVLVALVAGLTGGALYAVAWLFTALVD